MKRNIISILATIFVWASAAAAPAGEVVSTQQFRGADGDVEYAVAQQDGDKYKVSFKVIADDKDSELMRIINSGKDINVSTSSQRLFTTKVVEKSKLRGVVVAMLESEPVDASRMTEIMAARGETLRLGATGFALVMFPTEGDVVFSDMKRVMSEFPQFAELSKAPIPVTNTIVAPADPATTQPAVQPAVTAPVAQAKVEEKKEETPAQVTAPAKKGLTIDFSNATEFKTRNENGLFKISGTSIPSNVLNAASKMHFVQQSLMKTNQCRTAAMNMSTGGIYIYASNGYAYSSGMPHGFVENIKTFNQTKTTINDVVLTESNKWIIIYERNGYKTSGELPRTLIDKLGASNLANEQIRNVSLNDNGDWLVITNKGISCSGGAVQEFLDLAKEHHGKVEAAFISSNGAMIAMCKNGMECKNVPANVVEAMKTLQFIPKMIKFTDVGYYIISDGKTLVKYFL